MHRSRALQFAVYATAATCAWNGFAGSTAIVTGVHIGSLALGAFGLEATIDAAASGFLAWRFQVERSAPRRGDRLEHLAQRGIALALLAAGSYVAVRSVIALAASGAVERSAFAVAVAIASLLVLPILAIVKLRLARQLGSRALRGDGILTAAGSGLALTTLAGYVANHDLHVWWGDPLAALLIAAFLLREGSTTYRRAKKAPTSVDSTAGG